MVAEHLGVEEDKVSDESNFIDDLGADSLDTVELVMAFEEEFEIEGIKPIKGPEVVKLSPIEMGHMEEVVDMSAFLDDDDG